MILSLVLLALMQQQANQYQPQVPHILPLYTPSKPEPMDVPAIRVFIGNKWGCEDMRRVLLTAENGEKHCVLFQQQP